MIERWSWVRTFVRLALATTALAGVGAGSAEASTVTIGSALTASFTLSDSRDSQTLADLTLRQPARVASPTDGTVISWRFVGTGPLTPRVLHLTGSIDPGTGRPAFTGAGTGAPQTGSGGISGPFPISLPIEESNVFGVDVSVGSGIGVASSGIWLSWQPPLADGSAGRGPTTHTGELGIQAVIRYCLVPKVTGKTLKKAKRALRRRDCKVGKVIKTKKRRERVEVVAQNDIQGLSISDKEPVSLKISSKQG